MSLPLLYHLKQCPLSSLYSPFYIHLIVFRQPFLVSLLGSIFNKLIIGFLLGLDMLTLRSLQKKAAGVGRGSSQEKEARKWREKRFEDGNEDRRNKKVKLKSVVRLTQHMTQNVYVS